MKLEIGCGMRPTPGFVHMDWEPRSEHVELVADVHDIPIEDETVEEVRMVQVLEHIFWGDVLWVLAEINRVMKYGATITIEVPDADVAFGRDISMLYTTYTSIYADKKFEHTLTYMDKYTEGPSHTCFFTEKRLAWFLEQTGFKIISRNTVEEEKSVHAWLGVLSLTAEKYSPPRKSTEIICDIWKHMSGYKWIDGYRVRWDDGNYKSEPGRCEICLKEKKVIFPRPPRGIRMCEECALHYTGFEVNEARKDLGK